MFPKVCHVQILSLIKLINQINKKYLEEHVYKKHNKYIESNLNLWVNQDIA